LGAIKIHFDFDYTAPKLPGNVSKSVKAGRNPYVGEEPGLNY
jgi:hypothetical protein